jgi:hypothetical protein
MDIELPAWEKLRTMLFSSTARMFEMLLAMAFTFILDTVLLGVISSVTLARPSPDISIVKLFGVTCANDWGDCNREKKRMELITRHAMLSLVSKGPQLLATCSLS